LAAAVREQDAKSSRKLAQSSAPSAHDGLGRLKEAIALSLGMRRARTALPDVSAPRASTLLAVFAQEALPERSGSSIDVFEDGLALGLTASAATCDCEDL